MSVKSQPWTHKVVTHTPEETQKLSQSLIRQLPESVLIVLTGDLGAGKTTFVKGLASELGIDPHQVISPTFVLIREHDGERLLVHGDAYRASSPHEFLEVGLQEYFEREAVVVLEWGEKLDEILPENAIRLEFEILDADSRSIKISSPIALDL